MGLGDKISNMADEAKGKAEEALGNLRGDEDQAAQGQATQSGADVKQAGESVKDGDFSGAADNVKDAFGGNN